MKGLLYSGAARFFGLVPQALATALLARLIITHYGVDAYASYALIFSVFMLIPLGSLGVGPPFTQSVAAYGAEDDRSLRIALTGTRVLTVSGIGVAVVASSIGFAHLWRDLLGKSAGGNLYVTLAVVIYAATFVPMMGQSLLLGADRNHVGVTIQAFLPAVALAIVGVLVLLDADGGVVLLVPSLATLIIGLVTIVISSRLTGFKWFAVFRRIPFRAQYPGESIRALSIPIMITSIALPLAFAGDRVILSHFVTSAELAEYSLVISIFLPVTGLIAATAQPLWPMITRARVAGEKGPNIKKLLALFLASTLLVNVPLVLITPELGKLISGGDIHIGYELPMLAAALTCVQALATPLGMSMMDPAGARFAAKQAVIAVPVSLLSSVWLADVLKAPGILISAFFVSLFIQLIPAVGFARRRAASEELVTVL